MPAGTGVSGLRTVLGNMVKAHEQINAGKRRGLRKAGLIILREALQITPVDQGNLRASGYSDLDPIAARYVEIGYTAHYAPYVHELEQTQSGEPKFLQKAVNRKQGEAFEAMREESKL